MSESESALGQEVATFDVVGFIIAAEDGTIGRLAYFEGCSWLLTHDHLRGLQGSWQRAVGSLLAAGYLSPVDGSVTDLAREWAAEMDADDADPDL